MGWGGGTKPPAGWRKPPLPPTHTPPHLPAGLNPCCFRKQTWPRNRLPAGGGQNTKLTAIRQPSPLLSTSLVFFPNFISPWGVGVGGGGAAVSLPKVREQKIAAEIKTLAKMTQPGCVTPPCPCCYHPLSLCPPGPFCLLPPALLKHCSFPSEGGSQLSKGTLSCRIRGFPLGIRDTLDPAATPSHTHTHNVGGAMSPCYATQKVQPFPHLHPPSWGGRCAANQELCPLLHPRGS